MFLGFRISPWLFFAIMFGGWAAGFSLGYADRGCGERHATIPPNYPVPIIPAKPRPPEPPFHIDPFPQSVPR
jgi:hypothetical protein